MMDIVINSCYGGFSISLEAARWMAARGNAQAKAEVDEHDKQQGWLDYFIQHGAWPDGCDEKLCSYLDTDGGQKYFHGYGYVNGFDDGYNRADPTLVEAVKELGDRANGPHASLKIVTIPDGIEWVIDEYDGAESVEEAHRSWG